MSCSIPSKSRHIAQEMLSKVSVPLGEVESVKGSVKEKDVKENEVEKETVKENEVEKEKETESVKEKKETTAKEKPALKAIATRGRKRAKPTGRK